jgi:SnoaL-like domain
VSNRGIVEQYAGAMADQDLDAQVALLHDDYLGRYPQSDEIIRGRASFRAVAERYPGAEGGHLPVTAERIVGKDDEFITGPSWNLIHLAGSGDDFTLIGTITYPGGDVWHGVALLTLRDGKIWREVDYFAPAFERPEWRATITELEAEATHAG